MKQELFVIFSVFCFALPNSSKGQENATENSSLKSDAESQKPGQGKRSKEEEKVQFPLWFWLFLPNSWCFSLQRQKSLATTLALFFAKGHQEEIDAAMEFENTEGMEEVLEVFSELR